MRRFLPVIVLILMAPLVAELLAGSAPITLPILFPFLLIIYGPGALLIRELVRRSGRGWGSILLLGAVYGIVEEGLALQSLFNPTLYHASNWGAYILGINGVYSEFVIIGHAVWSAAIPILLTELLFPAQRSTPYLGRFGLVVTGIWYILGVVLVRAFIAPAYAASPVLLGIAALVALVLVVVALVVLPKQTPRPKLRSNAPSPWVVLLVTSIVGFVWLALLVLLWRVQPAFAHWPLVLVPMLGAIAVAVAMIRLVHSWAENHDWNDLHRIALASGALVPHTLVGCLVITQTTTARVGLIALGLAMTILLILFALRIRGRVYHDVDTPTESDSNTVLSGPVL